MQNKNIIIAVVVVALALSLYLAYANSQNKKATPKPEMQQAAESASVGEVVEAKKGDVVSGLPLDMILNKSGEVISSTSTLYEQNNKQYTVTFRTNLTISQEYQAYLDYLKKNKYTITRQDAGAELSSIYAKTDRADVNIAIYKDAVSGKNTVDIAYLLKK
jgi:hypothetical protein